MSKATFVPPIKGQDDEAVWETLREVSALDLIKDAFLRFRYSDGFSFARSLAFQGVLTIIPGVIFLVALATAIGDGRLQSLLREAVSSFAPGPAGQTLLAAFQQGSDAGSGDFVAMGIGGAAALISGATAMAQLQRGASRIYGVTDDRNTIWRYGLASILAVTVGLLLVVSFIVIALGGSFGGALADDVARTWAWGRWPLGLAALTLGLAALLKVAPNRCQPNFSWLALGGIISTVGWLTVSSGLAAYLNTSTAFGETYGPLAGFIGVMLWAQLSAIAIFFGFAVAAQLEAVGAGVTEPIEERDDDDVGAG